MKRFLSLLLVLSILPVAALADPGVVLCYRMNHYAAAFNEDHPGYFDYDTMIIDLYLMDDFKTAYYSKTIWANGKIDTTGFVRCTVTSAGDGKHVLSFPNQETMIFYYDEDSRLWLQMENGSFHLLECERFDIKNDLKSE